MSWPYACIIVTHTQVANITVIHDEQDICSKTLSFPFSQLPSGAELRTNERSTLGPPSVSRQPIVTSSKRVMPPMQSLTKNVQFSQSTGTNHATSHQTSAHLQEILPPQDLPRSDVPHRGLNASLIRHLHALAVVHWCG
jgi:hypothetical protein